MDIEELEGILSKIQKNSNNNNKNKVEFSKKIFMKKYIKVMMDSKLPFKKKWNVKFNRYRFQK